MKKLITPRYGMNEVCLCKVSTSLGTIYAKVEIVYISDKPHGILKKRYHYGVLIISNKQYHWDIDEFNLLKINKLPFGELIF